MGVGQDAWAPAAAGTFLGRNRKMIGGSHEDHRAVDGKPEVDSAQDHSDAFGFGNLSAEQVSAGVRAIRVPMVNAACWAHPAKPRARPCSAYRSPEVTATV